MNKIRSDSILNRLTPDQREMVEGWLFIECVGYVETRDRVKRMWNVECSLSAVGRFYRRKVQLRTLDELDQADEAAEAVNGSKADVAKIRDAALKVIAKRLLERSMDDGDPKELTALGKLLADAEKRDLQRQRLKLAREKFEFNAARAALKQLPLMNELKEDELDREDDRMQAMRMRLCEGKVPNDPYFKKTRIERAKELAARAEVARQEVAPFLAEGL
jgi:hypothetical protein